MKAGELNHRLKWNADNVDLSNSIQYANKVKLDDGFTFTFNPMQIRTFYIIYNHDNYVNYINCNNYDNYIN